VLAPGDGEAEPGEPIPILLRAHESGRKMQAEKEIGLTSFIPRPQSVASFAGSLILAAVTPRLGFAIAWASTLSACFAGSSNGSL